MTTFLTDFTDITRIQFSSKLNLRRRSELGQFLTPAPIARFMAGQFRNLSGHISLLDPGAGIGTLAAAFVEQLLMAPNQVESCFITAYEIETAFLPLLKQCLSQCCAALRNVGIEADYCLQEKNFIEAGAEVSLPLFTTSTKNFTHAILNPPYKKISNHSIEKRILSRLRADS